MWRMLGNLRSKNMAFCITKSVRCFFVSGGDWADVSMACLRLFGIGRRWGGKGARRINKGARGSKGTLKESDYICNRKIQYRRELVWALWRLAFRKTSSCASLLTHLRGVVFPYGAHVGFINVLCMGVIPRNSHGRDGVWGLGFFFGGGGFVSIFKIADVDGITHPLMCKNDY